MTRCASARVGYSAPVMNWKLKGTVQAAVGRLPAGDTLHYWMQRSLGGLRNFEREAESKMFDLCLMVEHLASAGVTVAGARFIEIGTGWYPTFPFGLALLGAARVDTFDLNRYLKPELVRKFLRAAPGHSGWLATATRTDIDELRARFERLRDRCTGPLDLAAWTDGVVNYQAPAGAATTGFPDGSVDVVCSNSVLEHVPEEGIIAMFREARRVLKPSGVMFHSVNCGDHFAYADRSISQLNYLRFSDQEWARWNNPFLYQNRLRAPDFTRMARDAGFAITLDISPAKPHRLAQLAAVDVHPSFQRYPPEQLCATSIDFIASPR